MMSNHSACLAGPELESTTAMQPCLQVRHVYDTVQPEQARNMDLLLIQAWLAAGDPDRWHVTKPLSYP